MSEQISISSLNLDADGHLANFNDWNEAIAKSFAVAEEIENLTDRHWVVINYLRKSFMATNEIPSIRKLTKESGVDTKELYELFPKGPLKKSARISGLPKPKGCI